jgi:cytochrome c1
MRTILGLAAAALAAAGVAAGIAACNASEAREPSHLVPGGDANRGKEAIVAYGCGSCHNIPGIAGARGMVGPPLDHFGQRAYIAGEVPNTADFLIRWITVPQSIEPGTAMPNLGVSDGRARDIAAYLLSLR